MHHHRSANPKKKNKHIRCWAASQERKKLRVLKGGHRKLGTLNSSTVAE